MYGHCPSIGGITVVFCTAISPAAGYGNVVAGLDAGDTELSVKVEVIEDRFLPALWSAGPAALQLGLDDVEGLHGGGVVLVVVELHRLLHSLLDEVPVWLALSNIRSAGGKGR